MILQIGPFAVKKCDQCGKYGEIDSGVFECVDVNPQTGKCSEYVFICDECLEKNRNMTTWIALQVEESDDCPELDTEPGNSGFEASEMRRMENPLAQADREFEQRLNVPPSPFLPDDETCWGDPRTPEEIEAEKATYQPGYVWRNPFTGEPL